ncbi:MULTISPECIES: TetR/AcrR family transcriptional regulator [unclassified Paenibacillus]|uniref:TetR/AcrR family transcriptional regulator n=1 Tax=unclassified Paenibacillus TaxID=185978 RepID=UPI000956C676|nr:MULTISPECIES: TetR/AcrR family transcriptional regulator [unclassified Paenibacillus]ASS67560.1 TetR/AcrR family transcriptional regulator [Paenibacillus sp. RUD330]SIQ72763.1 transcriptional regulator, TetR family [Paenibacillus sp. RU4X]SIQ94215.1 transcriptional regulator, TetR family [Paenibacillus sp. RU4T]
MPYPEGHKLKVRGKIIESAAQAFRTNGIRDISVPFIMRGAGLTHGGFYTHFDNKEQLVAEACRYAIDDTIALLQQAADREKEEHKIDAVIDYYLSPYHRDRTEMGCILPALSSEISRSSEEVRQVYTRELERMIGFISRTAKIDAAASGALLSTMVGALLLARSVADRKLSDSLLEASKEQAKRSMKV